MLSNRGTKRRDAVVVLRGHDRVITLFLPPLENEIWSEVDGVLNTPATSHHPESAGFDPAAFYRICRVQQDTGAHFVTSTGWRLVDAVGPKFESLLKSPRRGSQPSTGVDRIRVRQVHGKATVSACASFLAMSPSQALYYQKLTKI